MRRLLSGILLSFTIVTIANNAAFAGPFVHEPIKGEGYANKQKPAEPPIDPKKLAEAQPIMVAIKHCVVLEGIITEQFRLIDAFNNQPDIDSLAENASAEEKSKAMVYMMGRPDVADFGFLIPKTWMTAPRDQRTKFNALANLRINEAIGFQYGGYPFQDNCKGKMMGEISTTKNGMETAKVSMPLAFDVKDVTLTYILYRQKGYNWFIDDLLVNNIGVANLIKKDLGTSVMSKGLVNTIGDICKSSSFPTLRCGQPESAGNSAAKDKIIVPVKAEGKKH